MPEAGQFCTGTEFLFRTMAEFWKWMVEVVTHTVNVLNACMVHFLSLKMVHFMLCIFDYNKKKIAKKKFASFLPLSGCIVSSYV